MKKSNVTQRVLELKPDFTELKTELNAIEKQIDQIITKLEKQANYQVNCLENSASRISSILLDYFVK